MSVYMKHFEPYTYDNLEKYKCSNAFKVGNILHVLLESEKGNFRSLFITKRPKLEASTPHVK